MAEAAGVREPFDQQYADALAPAGAVGGGGERLAAAVGGLAALFAELREDGGHGEHIDSADQGEVALLVAQGLAGEVEGDQGRRAGGVHGDRRALQPEGVGDPSGQHAGGTAGDQIALAGLGVARQHAQVVLAAGSGVHRRARTGQRPGVDARALQHLPGGFEEESLLRVHAQRLARRDAEQLGVEVGRVGEEAAGLRVVAAERVEVPAAIGGEGPHGVGAGLDQRPQVFRGADAAGEAAGHANDDDRVVPDGGAVACGHRRGGGLGSAAGAGDLGGQEAGEGQRAGVVEDDGRGDSQTGGEGEAVTQLDGARRGEAEFTERPARLHLGARLVAEDQRHLVTHQFEQEAVALRLRGSRQPLGGRLALLVGGGFLGGALLGGLPELAHIGEFVEQSAGMGGGEEPGEDLPADVGEDERGLVALQRRTQPRQGEFGLHAEDAVAFQDVTEVAVGHAGARPRAPGHRGRDQSLGTAVLREGVQEGVAGGVVALPGRAEDPGERGEEDEGRQVQLRGDAVQVEGGGGLGPQRGLDAVGRERVHDAGVDDAGGVEDRGQRLVGGQLREDGGQRVVVGRVHRGHGDLGSRLPQFGGQFGRAGGLGPAPAEQQQVFRARGGEPPGDVCADAAGAAGDEHGAGRLPHPPGRGRLGAAQAGHEDPAGAYRRLVLVAAGEDGGEPGQCARFGFGGQVDQPAPLGVLVGGDPAEPPRQSLVRVRESVPGSGGDGAGGGAPQAQRFACVVRGVQQGDGEGEGGRGGGVFGGVTVGEEEQ